MKVPYPNRSFFLLVFSVLGCAAHSSLELPPPAERSPVAPAPATPELTLETTSYFAEGAPAAAKRAFDRGEYSDARALLRGEPGTNPVRFLRALAALRAGDAADAAAELRTLVRDYPALADRCALLLGQALERSGNAAEAALAYAQVRAGSLEDDEARAALARLSPESAPAQASGSRASHGRRARVVRPAFYDVPRPLFQAFWAYRRAGDLPRAMATLDAIEANGLLEGDAKAQVRYWRARVWEESGDLSTAATLLRELADSTPGSYYGLQARTRLANLGGFDAAAAQPEAGEGSRRQAALAALYADPRFAAGLELLRLGFPEAGRELARVRLADKPAEAKPLFLRVLYDGGNRREVKNLSSLGGLAGAPTEETEPVWRTAFPHTFRELVTRSAARAELNPNLLQALVREESRFNPRVRSPVGAVGLGQLMPATAELVAKRAGLAPVTEEALLEPRHNLKLASLYLASLLKQFDGNRAHAIAAYNAGPAAVEKWLRQRPAAETDEWVEEIPFYETREYVKRVLASYASYELLPS